MSAQARWQDAVVHDDAVPGNDRCADDRRLDAAGWVLGGLDPDDAERFARHLPTCLECRLTVAGLEPAARALLPTSRQATTRGD